MIFIILILILIILLSVAISHNVGEVKYHIKQLFFIAIGFGSFFLLIKILPPLIALGTSFFMVILPRIPSFLRIISASSILFGGFTKIFKNKIVNHKKRDNIEIVGSSSTIMTKDEALDILGLDNTPTKEEIIESYNDKIDSLSKSKTNKKSKILEEKVKTAKNILLKGLEDA